MPEVGSTAPVKPLRPKAVTVVPLGRMNVALLRGKPLSRANVPAPFATYLNKQYVLLVAATYAVTASANTTFVMAYTPVAKPGQYGAFTPASGSGAVTVTGKGAWLRRTTPKLAGLVVPETTHNHPPAMNVLRTTKLFVIAVVATLGAPKFTTRTPFSVPA